jgi:hypothetical protein
MFDARWSFAFLIAAFNAMAQNSDPRVPKIQPLPRPDPSAVIGEWSKSKMSSVDFVDRSTGAHASPSGERLNVHFFPDGTYKLGWLLQSSLYNLHLYRVRRKDRELRNPGRYPRNERQCVLSQKSRQLPRAMEL